MAVLVGIAGLAYAVVDARRRRREKELYYEVVSSRLFAASAPQDTVNTIKVVYERPGLPEEVLSEVYISEIGFVNIGKEPIRGADSAAADPIRIEITQARVLSVAVSAARRVVNNIKVEDVQFTANGAAAHITFDFLDYLDGAIIQVLTTEPDPAMSIQGTVIGMPSGIRSAEDAPHISRTLLRRARLVTMVAIISLFLTAIVLTAVNLLSNGWHVNPIMPHLAETLFFSGVYLAMTLTIAYDLLGGRTKRHLPLDFPRSTS